MSSKKLKANFMDHMDRIRQMDPKDVVAELSKLTDAHKGLVCPVPFCECQTVFKRWGDMRGHFLDDTTHKKDYFNAFLEAKKEPYCDQRGPGFNHGLNSLILSLVTMPTALDDAEKIKPEKKVTIADLVRPKKARPVQEQQSLLGKLGGLGQASEVPPRLHGPSPSEFSKLEWDESLDPVEVPKKADATKKTVNAFSQLSEFIRDSNEINKVWRGKVWDEYVDMFHGIPPCFHCRSEEGKQIHHQNPLFHEIILVSLNKLGTTAEEVMGSKERGKEELLNAVLQEVFAYHMRPGKVCAVPYCANCNQDAETKRRRGKKSE